MVDRPMGAVTRIVGVLLGVAGLGMSLLLTVASARGGRGPGCGAGGCGAVLTSTWAKVAGLPVAALAVVVYAIAIVLLAREWELDGRRRAVLAILAGVLLAAAAWFTYVQGAVVGGWCPWCLATHGVGVAMAAVLLIQTPHRRRFAMLGVPAVLALAVVQAVWPTTDQPIIARTDRPVAAIAGGSAAPITLPAGSVIDPSELPRIGAPGARHIAAVLFDYACPHCRSHHETFAQYEQSAPDALALAAMPVPLSSACNPHWPAERDMERFAASCDLARLSLVVWKLDPGAWRALDTWLWAQPTVPSSAAARRKVLEVTVEAELAAAEARFAGWADEQIRRAADAWAALDQPSLPITLAPGMEPIYGAAHDPQVFADLVAELDAPPGPTP